MAEYKKTVYFGADETAKAMSDSVERYGGEHEFNQSQMEFMRHCIRFTLANDPQIKTIDRRIKKGLAA